MDELNFTLRRVKPLFEALGYFGVHYVGGSNPPERGRDLVFYEHCDKPILFRRDMAAQVKKGDINAGSAAKLLSQIDEAFNHPHIDPETGQQKRISLLFIVASGKIQNSVKERIQTERPLLAPFIAFLDGDQILQHERKVMSSRDRISNAERQIQQLGLHNLLGDNKFAEIMSQEICKLHEEGASPLMIVARLSERLVEFDKIRSALESLLVTDKKEVLECLSILLLNRLDRRDPH
jgi:hypothetical protein